MCGTMIFMNFCWHSDPADGDILTCSLFHTCTQKIHYRITETPHSFLNCDLVNFQYGVQNVDTRIGISAWWMLFGCLIDNMSVGIRYSDLFAFRTMELMCNLILVFFCLLSILNRHVRHISYIPATLLANTTWVVFWLLYLNDGSLMQDRFCAINMLVFVI